MVKINSSRKYIVRQCKTHGCTIQPGALQLVEDYLSETLRDPLDALEDFLQTMARKMITPKDVEEYLRQLEENGGVGSHKETQIQVTNAFDMPRLGYQPLRRQFVMEHDPKGLFGTPQEKVSFHESSGNQKIIKSQPIILTLCITNVMSTSQIERVAQRYSLVHQRLLRHELFRPIDLMHSTSRTQFQLTPIESLLGQSTREAALLLGILVQMDDASYHLEDPTGHIRLEFSQAEAVDSFFVTEHCVLLVEGVVLDDVFYVHRLGQPLPEARVDSLRAIRQHVTHSRFQPLSPSSVADDAPPMLVFSDVALDQPKNMQMLERLFASYENASPARLPLFVLMGNFCSTPSSKSACRALLEELAHLVSSFQNIAEHAHICLVPGPNDGSAQVLPLPPLSCPTLAQKVPHVHLATNPCRIEWNGQETVVFRHDLVALFQSQHIRLETKNNANEPPHCRLLKTILDQGHLVPVAGVPIYWNYDEALRLYPLPHNLILGGDASESYQEDYQDCRIVHPGSLAQRGDYAVVHVTDNGDTEFGQLGVEAS